MPRRKRIGEYTCKCDAYRFPHRFGGGRCRGLWVAEKAWELCHGFTGICGSCIHANTDELPYCEVLAGQERLRHCQAWQEFVAENEIPIPKKLRR